MFEGLSLENMALALYREGDYTIRLFNNFTLAPKQYLFALLRFDSGRDVWTVSLVDQNLRTTWGEEETARSFEEAKQTVIDKIENLWSQMPDYKITKVDTGYYIPPWLQRKSPIPTRRHVQKATEKLKSWRNKAYGH